MVASCNTLARGYNFCAAPQRACTRPNLRRSRLTQHLSAPVLRPRPGVASQEVSAEQQRRVQRRVKNSAQTPPRARKRC